MGGDKRDALAYWHDRAVLLNERLLGIGEDYYKGLAKAFERAANETQKEIEAFYGRFAEGNSISISQAEEILTGAERKRFAMELETYIEQASRFPYSQYWARQLEDASTVHRVTRLQSLELQMRHQAEMLFSGYHDSFSGVMETIYTEGYYQNIYEFQKEYGVGSPFATVDTQTVRNIMAKPWTPDDKTFSSRIWQNRQDLIDYLNNELSVSFIRGEGYGRLIREVAKRFCDPGSQSAMKDAERLILTEGAYFSALSQRDSYKELGFKKYIIITVNDENRSLVCKEMDGEVFDLEDFQPGITANPFHPRCRSTTAPYAGSRKGKKGPGMLYDHDKKKMYTIPEGMTYKEWLLEHVEDKDVTESPRHDTIELTDNERGAVNRYLGAASYSINEKLRTDQFLTEFESAWLDDFNLALEKMGDYKGEAIRTMHLSGSQLEAFLNEYHPGDIIESKAFLSFSKLQDYDDNANVRIGIISSKAKDISSFNPGEQEVIYPIGSKFVVLLRSLAEGIYYIVLEEYDGTR